MTVDRSQKFRLRTDGIAWHEIDGQVVLLDLRSSLYVSINASGSVLWKLLLDGSTRADLVAELQRRFHIDEATATGDVDAFLASCEQRGLVEGA
jgi:hypothetical protein